MSQAKMHRFADFSENFSQLMNKSGYSQVEIAEKTGLHKQSVNRYANGKSKPGWEDLVKLAQALDCSLDSFLIGEILPKPGDTRNAEALQKLEEMKPIIRELGSVVETLTSFISDNRSAKRRS